MTGILQRISGDVLSVLASDVVLFPIGTVIRHILSASTEIVYTCSAVSNVLSVFDFSILCPVDFDISDCTCACVYDEYKQHWKFSLVGCEDGDAVGVRSLCVATYLSIVMTRYPLAAARMCDVSMCVLRGVGSLSVVSMEGVPPMFVGCECILSRLRDLRASSAFEELIGNVCDSDELKNAGAGKAGEARGGYVDDFG